MGVIVCSRRDCENIMCDRCSPEHGYICNECLSELKEKSHQYGFEVETFMNSSKSRYDLNKGKLFHQYYDEVFSVD